MRFQKEEPLEIKTDRIRRKNAWQNNEIICGKNEEMIAFISIQIKEPMENKRLRIVGQNVTSLTDMLQAMLGSDYAERGPHVDVLAIEKYYLRIDSNLLSVVILRYVSEGECEVTILTGGGKQGIWGISWGAENSDSGRIFDAVIAIAQDRSWQVQEIV